MNAKTPDMTAASKQFMITDLARSGLTDKDIQVEALPVMGFTPVESYRIDCLSTPDGEPFWQIRWNRDEAKYTGPDNVVGIWARSAEHFEAWKASKVKLVVEGAKKAASALKHLRIPAIGITGCWGYMRSGTPMPEVFGYIKDDDFVYLVLDGDMDAKPDIAKAARRFCTLTKAEVRVVRLGMQGDSKVGLDDWIVARLGEGTKGVGLRKAFESLEEADQDTLPESRDDLIRRLDLDYDIKQLPGGVTMLVLRKTVRNCRLLVEDRFTDRVSTDQYLGPVFDRRSFADPGDDLHIRESLESSTGVQWPKDLVVDARRGLLQTNRTNEIGEWLRSLKWDGTERLSTMWQDICGSDDQPADYLADTARALMLGMVKRCLDPGTKFDFMTLLVGEQGIGKTTFWETLAGRFEGMPMCRAVHLGDVGELNRTAERAWLLNFDELASTKRADLIDLKNWLTLTHDSWVPKYVEHVKERARTFIAVGTTNDDTFLTDVSGNRRFLPVRVKGVDIDQLLEVRDQLFAEAVALSDDPPARWWVVTGAHEQQEAHRIVHPFEEAIERYLERYDTLPVVHMGPRTHARFTTTQALMRACGIDTLSGDAQRVARDRAWMDKVVAQRFRNRIGKGHKVRLSAVDVSSVERHAATGNPALDKYFQRIDGERYPTLVWVRLVSPQAAPSADAPSGTIPGGNARNKRSSRKKGS